jgi:hypothetical protein
MAMVKAYRLNLVLKFTGVAVAGELSTAILVNMANALWGHLPNPERRTLSRPRHIIFIQRATVQDSAGENSISKTRR